MLYDIRFTNIPMLDRSRLSKPAYDYTLSEGFNIKTHT